MRSVEDKLFKKDLRRNLIDSLTSVLTLVFLYKFIFFEKINIGDFYD